MTEEINELILDWKHQLDTITDQDPLTPEGQKNMIRAELINRFIEQLRYLRDDV